MSEQPSVEPGGIVQVDPDQNERWGACLVVVSEVKLWGVRGYTRIPMGGDAFIGLRWGSFVVVGEAEWVRGDEDADAPHEG